MVLLGSGIVKIGSSYKGAEQILKWEARSNKSC